MPQPRADDVAAVPAQVVDGTNTRLEVVAVRLRIESEVFEADDAIQQPGAGGRLDLHEIGVQRLIEHDAGDQVIAQSEVERQAIARAPVVLDIRPILLVRDVRIRVTGAHRYRPHRTVRIVVEHRVDDHVFRRVERRIEARLVDEVQADLEIMAKSTTPGDVPGEVVTQLILPLLGGLRRVDVRAGDHAVGKRQIRRRRSRRDQVAEIGELEDEFVQHGAAHRPVVVHVDRIQRVLAVAPVVCRRHRRRAVRLAVRVTAISH